MKTDLEKAEKELKRAEKHYVTLCKAYSDSDDNTEGALFELLKAMKAYDDLHIAYSVEYSKADHKRRLQLRNGCLIKD